MTLKHSIQLVLLAALAVLAGCGGPKLHFVQEGAPEDDLPKIRGDRFLDKAWDYRLSEGFTAETNILEAQVVGDSIFMAGPEGDVASLAIADGTVNWRVELDTPLTAGVGVGDGLVMVATSEGEVIALSAGDGSRIWGRLVGGEVLARPVSATDVVIVRVGDDRLVGLDSSTGEVRWSIVKNVTGLSVRGISTPLLNGRGVVAGLADGRLLAADVDTGNVLWESAVGRRRGSDRVQQLADIDADPALYGTILYVASFQSRIAAMALGNPRVIWSAEVSTLRDLEIDENNVYVVAAGGTIVALNRYSGEELWRQEALRGRGLSPAMSYRDKVIVGDFEGHIYQLDGATGEPTSMQKSGGGAVISKPLRVGDVVFLSHESGRISAMKLL